MITAHGASDRAINAARAQNPAIKTLVRARYLNERELLEQVSPDAVCYDEAEAATALSILLRAHARADGYDRGRLAKEQPVLE